MTWFRHLWKRLAGGQPAPSLIRQHDQLTPRQRRENAWARAGWVTLWIPTRAHPSASERRRRYWGRVGDDGILRLFPGVSRPPDHRSEPHLHVNGTRVYRDFGHPDGPSSTPAYIVRRDRAYPSDGCLTGSDDRPHYGICPIRRHGTGVTIRKIPQRPPDE